MIKSSEAGNGRFKIFKMSGLKHQNSTSTLKNMDFMLQSGWLCYLNVPKYEQPTVLGRKILTHCPHCPHKKVDTSRRWMQPHGAGCPWDMRWFWLNNPTHLIRK